MVNKPTNITVSMQPKGKGSSAIDLGTSSAKTSDIGQIRIGQIRKVDFINKTATVYVISDNQEKTVSLPGFMYDADEESGFWYGLSQGDLVLLCIAYGNNYFVINKIGNPKTNIQKDSLDIIFDPAFFKYNSDSKNQTFSNELSSGTFMIKSKNNTKIVVSPKEGVFAGYLGSSSLQLNTQNNFSGQGGSATL